MYDEDSHEKDSELKGAHFTVRLPGDREYLEGSSVRPAHLDDEAARSLASGAVGMTPALIREDSGEGGEKDSVAEKHVDAGPRSESRPEPEPESAPSPEPAPAHAASHRTSHAPAHAAAHRGNPLARLSLPAKVLLGLAAVLVVVIVAGLAWVSSLNATMGIAGEDREELNAALASSESAVTEPFYVLLIGSDARKNDTVSRSDTIMLARVDIAGATVSLVSIPRDTMIYTEGGYVDKINSAYNNGPAATVRAVSEFCGVNITHYVEVDFNGVKDVVDALGGITVDVPEDIDDYKAKLTLSAGEQVLDGATALKYARARYDVTGGDFGRVRAQRQVVEAIARKVLASSPMELPGVVTELAESITTDLSVTDIISYALAIQQSEDGLTIYSATVPSYGYEQGGVSYVGTEFDEWRAMMQRMDAGLDPADESAVIPAEQLEDERLGAATNCAAPRDYYYLAEISGFTSEDVAQAGVDKPGQQNSHPNELLR